jgi:hypothetical protein
LEKKKSIKSKSALSKYVAEDKHSIDFDEIPSVKLREDIKNIQEYGVPIPDLSMSQANMSYNSSQSINGEEDKLLDKISGQ